MFGVRFGQSNRTACLWAVTVPHVTKTKLEIFESLRFFCVDLVVAEELHQDRSKHHHIYMRTSQPFLHTNINDIISTIYDITDIKKFQVGTVQKLANYLKYISKEDLKLLFKGYGIEDQFSFYYLTHKWAESVEEFRYSDPYVLKHPNYYKLLEQVYLQVQQIKSYRPEIILRPYIWCCTHNPNIYNWQTEVIIWWNDWAINGYSHKKAQLYLFGESHIGKTTFVLDLFKASINPVGETNEDYYENHIFKPTPKEDKYSYQTYEPKKQLIMFIDEFNVSDFSFCDLKKCLAGESFMTNVKQGSPKSICIRKPQILISNYPPPRSDKYKGFIERLKVVYADRKYF